MSEADGATEEHARAELSDALERRRQDIIDRWVPQVRALARAIDVPHSALEDGVADYLRRLAELLRGHHDLSGAGAAAWKDVAREHAITRAKLGFDVLQLGHELVLLRRTAVEVLSEEGVLRNVQQLSRVTDLIDAAMNASIKSYVDYRDYETRRQAAEHIGFLTHELRNPLGAIALAASQLRRPDSAPSQLRLLDAIDRNVDRLQHMISDVLLTERMQSGHVQSQPIETTVGELLDDFLEPRQHAARAKGLELKATFDPKLQLYVDPKLTMSAIENLVDNAIKFTDDGEVTLDVEMRAGEIVFHVRDQCPGLSEEELRVIFEPFQRAHSNKPGTGLGLAIARRAVEAQGGRIEAESVANVGCHFWLTLPRPHH